MDARTYQEVSELFLEVCDLSLAERESVLARRCKDRPDLRREVERMLRSDPRLEGAVALGRQLDASGSYEGTPGTRGPLGTHHPRKIGAFEILDVLGEGGMGIVYLAQQSEPIRRRVAVKVIRAGLDSRQVEARFEAERQALALLDHPHIAGIHDAGSTEDGRPYFVMELIEGLPITRYCDDHRLGVVERLHVFLQVCDALEHAHDRGIIHRDLKPSNLLVAHRPGHEPTCKVIDFGIAKATDQQLTEKTLCTEVGRILGTLDYMSPEQAGSLVDDADHRSDIYSLGVILYEILTGELPLRLETSKVTYDEVLRRIREEEPPAPSTQWSRLSGERMGHLAERRGTRTTSIGSLLRGELDWITMKALEKEPARRYAHVADLAADLRRAIRGEPVHARPPSRIYRARKFVRKNRGLVVATLAVVLTLTAGLVTSLLLYRVTRTALRTATDRQVEILRLSDIQRLSELRAEAPELIRRHPGKRRAMLEWIAAAEALGEDVETHRASLARIRERALPGSPADAPRFADTDLAWRHQILSELVEGISDLLDPDAAGVTIDRVKRWLTRAASEEELDHAWRETIAAIRDPDASPRYGGLVIRRQAALIPLGPDIRSGLQEFVDARTGLTPVRASTGNYRLDEVTGVVLVLVPGGEFTMGSPAGEQFRVYWEHGLGKATDRTEEEMRAYRDALRVADLFQRGCRLALGPEETPFERWVVGALLPGPTGEPLHRVRLRPFLIGKYEMTQEVWTRAMGSNPSLFRSDEEPHHSRFLAVGAPLNRVSWEQCAEFCRRTGLRMPTEAEWEYACRAGTTGAFGSPTGQIVDVGHYYEYEGQRPHPPGEKRANGFGIHDMHGNVWEWCEDPYDPEFYLRPEAYGPDPICTTPNPHRVQRGGSYASNPWDCRAGRRRWVSSVERTDQMGLRAALSLE